MIFPKAHDVVSNAFNFGPKSITGISQALDFIPLLNEYLEQSKTQDLTNHLIILPDEEACQSFSKRFLNNHNLILNPSPQPYSDLLFSSKTMLNRIKAFYRALNTTGQLFISHPAALSLLTISPTEFKEFTENFEFADNFFNDPTETLMLLGYKPTPFVESPGQFSEKGGIIDLYSPSEDNPVRLSLFGNEIESIHSYSVDTQRNLSELERFTLTPAAECFYTEQGQKRLLNLLHNNKVSEHEWKTKSIDSVRNKVFFDKMHLFMSSFWQEPNSALSFFDPKKTNVICFDYKECEKKFNHYKQEIENDYEFIDESSYKRLSPPHNILAETFTLKNYQSLIDVTPVFI